MNPIQFLGDDPGAVTLGNFINYYHFHPPEERLKFLPDHLWSPNAREHYVCLDIGCNTGVSVSCSLPSLCVSHAILGPLTILMLSFRN